MSLFKLNLGEAGNEGLFANYEVNSESHLPIFAKLITGSLVLHATCVLCLVYVPAVRDAFNLAAMFSGVHYVDEAYRKTQVGERAQVITLAKFHYPEGYFAMFTQGVTQGAAQPVAVSNAQAAQIVSQYKPPPAPRPVKQPKIKTEAALATPSPTVTPVQASAAASPLASPSPALANNLAKEEQDNKTKEEVEKDLDRIAAENHIKRPREINKKPYTDWLAKARKMKDDGQLDLNGTIELTAEADRDSDGKLSNIEVTEKTGDPKLLELAKELIAALGDSGALDFLEGVDHLSLTVKLNETDVAATASTEMKSVDIASQRARGYSLALGLAGKIREGHDEEAVYKNTRVSANGKQIILNFNMPRALAGEILSKQHPTT